MASESRAYPRPNAVLNVKLVSPVRALVYSTRHGGGAEEVSVVAYSPTEGGWRCAGCQRNRCIHTRALQEALDAEATLRREA